MTRFSHRLCAILVVLAVAGCGSAQQPAAARAPGNPAAAEASAKTNAKQQLQRLVERYWDEHIPVLTVISPQLLADSLAVERRYLDEVSAISRDALDDNSRLTYDIFKRRRETLIEGFTYPVELLPLGSFGVVLRSIQALSADSAQQPWSTADYESWLKRLNDYVNWTRQAIQNMREGVRRGYVSPRFLIEHSIAMLKPPATDASADLWRVPLRSMPSSIVEPDRGRLKNTIGNAIDTQLLPANQALRDFLQHEYLPHGRPGIALTDLPLGDKWYAYDIRRASDTALTPDQIHAIGLAEVERLRSRLPPDHEAAQSTILSAEELLKAYQALIPQVQAAMMPLFEDPPSAPLGVRGTEYLADPNAALSYRAGGLVGKPAPLLYVNISPAALRAENVSTPSFLQQALPGHHLQATLARHRVDLPRFRRMEDDPAFVEGWGMYAASLGEQLGMLTDEASRTEALELQLRCTVGLVVDTGLHAKGWTRQQALDYLHGELPLDDAGAQAMLDDYAANPGDALACKMGELNISGLRSKAQQVLGSGFDIRAFHAAILEDGAMPLDILDAKMKIWMDAAR